MDWWHVSPLSGWKGLVPMFPIFSFTVEAAWIAQQLLGSTARCSNANQGWAHAAGKSVPLIGVHASVSEESLVLCHLRDLLLGEVTNIHVGLLCRLSHRALLSMHHEVSFSRQSKERVQG